MTISIAIFLLVFFLSWVIATVVRVGAIRFQLLDVPNSRSSHSVPVPRGGGVAIVIAYGVGLWMLGIFGVIPWLYLMASFPAALAVALIGLVDDRFSIPALPRLLVHLLASIFLVLALSTMMFEMYPVHGLPWVEVVLYVIVIVWLTNLVNFMDGLDGYAASESVFVATCMLILTIRGGGSASVVCSAAILAVATAGFLIPNWPPAKLFMGDVGSGFLGFSLGALIFAAVMEGAIELWPPLILIAAFSVDATYTLIRRMIGRQRWYEPHRTHAYQKLCRRLGSHRAMTTTLILVNILWLAPLSLMASIFVQYGVLIALVAHLPILAVVVHIGAGRPDNDVAGAQG